MLWALLCLLAAVASTGAIVVSKRLAQECDLFHVAAAQFFFTALFLVPAAALMPAPPEGYALPLPAAGAILLAALLNVSSVYIYLRAIKSGSISILVPLRNTTPLFVAFLAIVLLSEQVTATVIGAALLIVAGAALLNQAREKGKAALARGAGAALLVALMAAFVFIIVKYITTISGPVPYLVFSSLAAAVISGAFLALAPGLQPFVHAARRHGRAFLLLGILAAAASLATVYAISLEKASVVSTFLRVELLFAVAAGALFFKEEVGISKIAGALLVLAGLVLVIMRGG